MDENSAPKFLEIFFLSGLLLRCLISGRIYYWSNYIFLAWFSLAYLLALLFSKSAFPIPRLLKIGLGLFFASLILSMPFGIQPLSSGRELVIFLGYLFILLSGLEILNHQEPDQLLSIIILAAIIQSLAGLRQYFGGLESMVQISGNANLAGLEQVGMKRIFGLTFSPDFFSVFLAAALILWIGLVEKNVRSGRKQQSLYLSAASLIALLLLIPMLLSKSIGGFLSFLIGIAVLVALRFSSSLFSKKNIVSLILIFLTAASVLSIFAYRRRANIFQGESNPVILRLYNFQAGLQVFREKPWLGVGLGNFWIAYPKYRQARSNEVRYAHNNFIQVLAEAGPAALAGLLALILSPLLAFRKILARKDPLLNSIFAALLVLWSHWLWDFDLYAPELASLSFALLAAITIQLFPASSQKVSRLSRAGLALLIAVLGLGAGWVFAEQRAILKAQSFFNARDLNQGRSYAQKALSIIPGDDYAYALLAFSATQKGEKESLVEEYFQKAIGLNPRFAFWHKRLADYYFKQGRIRSAEMEYQRGLELYPNNLEMLVRMARIHRLNGDPVQAETFARKALAVSGDHQAALWELARIKLSRGQQREMLEILKELSEKYRDLDAGKLLEKYSKESEK